MANTQASKNYIDFNIPAISATWLNGVDAALFDAWGGPETTTELVTLIGGNLEDLQNADALADQEFWISGSAGSWNTASILDQDDMASDSAADLATQQSIKAYSQPLISASITAFNDEDDMASNSATALCSQQSIKKYADDNAGQMWVIDTPVDTSTGEATYTISGLPSNITTLIWNVKSISYTSAITPFVYVQVSDATSGFHTSGYKGTSTTTGAAVATVNFLSAFGVRAIGSSSVWNGQFILQLLGNNIYTFRGWAGFSNGAAVVMTYGAIALDDVLDGIRLTTELPASATFDSGEMNTMRNVNDAT